MLKSSVRLFPLFTKTYFKPYALKTVAPLLQKLNFYAFSKQQKHEESPDKHKHGSN